MVDIRRHLARLIDMGQIKPQTLAIAAGLGMAALLALYLAKKGVAGAVAGAVTAAGDAAVGTVYGIGDFIGIPRTDAERCAKAKADGDLWAQSLYCPAGDFIDAAASAPVYAIGDALGVPRTNETECERAKREGRTWDASFACPAGDFLGFLFRG